AALQLAVAVRGRAIPVGEPDALGHDLSLLGGGRARRGDGGDRRPRAGLDANRVGDRPAPHDAWARLGIRGALRVPAGASTDVGSLSDAVPRGRRDADHGVRGAGGDPAWRPRRGAGGDRASTRAPRGDCNPHRRRAGCRVGDRIRVVEPVARPLGRGTGRVAAPLPRARVHRRLRSRRVDRAASARMIERVQVALTREVSASIARCELTHQARVPIDVGIARAQHAAYERALADAGYRVERIAAADDLPDAVFVEDIAVVVDELAVVARPGAESRRAEIPPVEAALRAYRTIVAIEPPGTLDGGDVLRAGRRVFVGVSSRTNRDAVAQLRRLLAPCGYTVDEVTVAGCLHLKSAVTAAGDDVLVVNPEWIPAD